MTFKEFWKREGYVASHAQTWQFRVVKYIALFAVGYATYIWKGWSAVGIVFAVLFALSIGIHFLFRWKTDAWTRPWGPYKPVI